MAQKGHRQYLLSIERQKSKRLSFEQAFVLDYQQPCNTFVLARRLCCVNFREVFAITQPIAKTSLAAAWHLKVALCICLSVLGTEMGEKIINTNNVDRVDLVLI